MDANAVWASLCPLVYGLACVLLSRWDQLAGAVAAVWRRGDAGDAR